MHINEVSKRLYPRISRNPNFGPIFPGKKCGLSAGKYGIHNCLSKFLFLLFNSLAAQGKFGKRFTRSIYATTVAGK